jgi:hypothetical protein
MTGHFKCLSRAPLGGGAGFEYAQAFQVLFCLHAQSPRQQCARERNRHR